MRTIVVFILGILFMVLATGNILELIDVKIKKTNDLTECFIAVFCSLTVGMILLSMAVKSLPP